MLEGLDGYLRQRARELGLDRADQLAEIQLFLDKKYPGKCHAVSLNEGVLKITTPSASVASELRWSKAYIIRRFKGVERIYIKIA